jgi:hypothetical protein
MPEVMNGGAREKARLRRFAFGAVFVRPTETIRRNRRVTILARFLFAASACDRAAGTERQCFGFRHLLPSAAWFRANVGATRETGVPAPTFASLCGLVRSKWRNQEEH